MPPANIEDLAAEFLERFEMLEKRIEMLEKHIQASAEMQLESDDFDDGDDDGESVGEEEDPNDPWNIKFKELRRYRVEHGDCKVSQKYERNPSLGTWVTTQRARYNNVRSGKKGAMTINPERIDKLDGIGFFWGKKYSAETDRSFEENLADLIRYKEAMGNCSVHSNHPLGKWMAFVRAEYRLFKKGEPSLIGLDEIAQLKSVGFRWKATAAAAASRS